MGRIHVPAMEPLLRTSPRALVSRVYSVCTLFRDSCPPVSNFSSPLLDEKDLFNRIGRLRLIGSLRYRRVERCGVSKVGDRGGGGGNPCHGINDVLLPGDCPL